MRTVQTTSAIVAVLLAGTFGGLVPAMAGQAAPCGDVTLVFARGSGQDLSEREAPIFFDSVDDRLDRDVRVARYELGTEAHGGARYPAVGGWRDLLEAEASWTGSLGGRVPSQRCLGCRRTDEPS